MAQYEMLFPDMRLIADKYMAGVMATLEEHALYLQKMSKMAQEGLEQEIASLAQWSNIAAERGEALKQARHCIEAVIGQYYDVERLVSDTFVDFVAPQVEPADVASGEIFSGEDDVHNQPMHFAPLPDEAQSLTPTDNETGMTTANESIPGHTESGGSASEDNDYPFQSWEQGTSAHMDWNSLLELINWQNILPFMYLYSDPEKRKTLEDIWQLVWGFMNKNLSGADNDAQGNQGDGGTAGGSATAAATTPGVTTGTGVIAQYEDAYSAGASQVNAATGSAVSAMSSVHNPSGDMAESLSYSPQFDTTAYPETDGTLGTLGMTGGLTGGVVGGLTGGLAGGLTGGLIGGLAGGAADGLSGGITSGVTGDGSSLYEEEREGVPDTEDEEDAEGARIAGMPNMGGAQAADDTRSTDDTHLTDDTRSIDDTQETEHAYLTGAAALGAAGKKWTESPEEMDYSSDKDAAMGVNAIEANAIETNEIEANEIKTNGIEVNAIEANEMDESAAEANAFETGEIEADGVEAAGAAVLAGSGEGLLNRIKASAPVIGVTAGAAMVTAGAGLSLKNQLSSDNEADNDAGANTEAPFVNAQQAGGLFAGNLTGRYVLLATTMSLLFNGGSVLAGIAKNKAERKQPKTFNIGYAVSAVLTGGAIQERG